MEGDETGELEENPYQEIMRTFQENKGKLEKGLDDLLQIYLRTDKDIRTQLWNLFQRKRFAFFPVILGTLSEDFLEDIKEEASPTEEDLKELKKFIRKYSELEEEFGILVSMDRNNEMNPLTHGNFDIKQARDKVMLIEMVQYSGSKHMLETRMKLTRFSTMILNMLDNWRESLDKIEEDENFPRGDQIPSSDKKTLREDAEKLEKISEKISEKVDKALPKEEE